MKLKNIYEVTITLEYQEVEFGNLSADLQEMETLYRDKLLNIEIQKERVIDHNTPKEKDKAMLM